MRVFSFDIIYLFVFVDNGSVVVAYTNQVYEYISRVVAPCLIDRVVDLKQIAAAAAAVVHLLFINDRDFFFNA